MAKSLFTDFLREHHRDSKNDAGADLSDVEFELLSNLLSEIVFNGDSEKLCINVNKDKKRLYTSFFVGADLLSKFLLSRILFTRHR